MWKKIEIEEKIYFFECDIIKNVFKFVLYDLKRSWCENIELSEVLLRAKELNRRIEYDRFTIQATLTGADAVEALIENSAYQAANTEEVQQSLKLKYRIDEHPFHFKWQLKEQTELEFRESVTLPLFMVVHGMCQQIEQLRDVIGKKDIELQQYKEEGAILRRTTVKTQPFDFTQFDDKYAEVNKVTKGLQDIATNIKEQFENERKIIATNEEECKATTSAPKAQTEAAKSTNLNVLTKERHKISPRSRKRKNLDMQHMHMQMKLNARKQKLEYESSQSQSLSDSPPPADVLTQELAAIQHSLRELEKQRLADLKQRTDNSHSLSHSNTGIGCD